MEDTVRTELEALRSLADRVGVDALRDGTWLVAVADHVLDGAEPLEALHERHGALHVDDIAEARIVEAQRAATLAGGLSAATYASVVVATIATGGVGTALALPTAVGAFAADLYFTAVVQLRLGHALLSLYGRALDLARPEQVASLVRLSFGVDDDDELHAAAGRFAPEASRLANRAVTTAVRLAGRASVPAVGRQVLARSVAKLAFPAIGVPLCAGVNHYTTGVVGRRLARRLRGAREAGLQAERLLTRASDPTLVAHVLHHVLAVDAHQRATESSMLEVLHARLDIAPIPVDEMLARVHAAREHGPALVAAAIEAAAVDGSLHTAENALLERIATAAGVPHDPRAIAAAVMRYR